LANLSRAQTSSGRFLAYVSSAVVVVAIASAALFMLWRAASDPSSTTIDAPTIAGHLPGFDTGQSEGGALLWQLENAEQEFIHFRTVAAFGDVVYRVIDTPLEFNGIEAIDGRTGDVLWRSSLPVSSSTEMKADSRGVYVFEFSRFVDDEGMGHLTALSVFSGAEIWQTELAMPVNWSVGNDAIYVVDRHDVTTAVNAIHGTTLWTFDAQTGGYVFGPGTSIPVVGAVPFAFGDTVVTFANGGLLIGLDRETGMEKWRKDGFHPSATRFAAAGDVLTTMTFQAGADADGILETDSNAVDWEDETWLFIARVSAIDPTDGSALWHRVIASQALELVATDSVVAFIGNEFIDSAPGSPTPDPSELQGVLLEAPPLGEALDRASGFDPVSGELLWTVHAGETYFTTMATWIPASGMGGGIVALTAEGRMRPIGFWREGDLMVPDERVNRYPQPIAGDFGFVVVLENGDLAGVAVNERPSDLANATPVAETAASDSSPSVLWTSPVESEDTPDITLIAVSENSVFRFTTTYGSVESDAIEALDGQTATRLWKEPAPWALVPPVADSANLYYASYSGPLQVMKIVAVDTATGQAAWTVTPNRTVMGLTASDGVLYAEVSPNTLMAIRDGEILWESAIDPYVDPVSSNELMTHMHGPVVTTGMVVGMAANGTIAGFDPVDGKRLWTSVRSPGPGSEYVVAGDVLVRFRPLPIEAPLNLQSTPSPNVPIRSEIVGADLDDDAAALWRHEMDGYAYPIGVVDDTVYFIEFSIEFAPATPYPTDDLRDGATGTLFALNARTGELRAIETRTGRAAFMAGAAWSPEHGSTPLVITGSVDGVVTLVDAASQTVVETIQAEPADSAVVDIQIDNGIAYLLFEDGSVAALPLVDESP
jgi:outer membrane protein assembly factor BamB